MTETYGPSNDEPEAVQIEIRAAEIGQNPYVWRRFMDLDPEIDRDIDSTGMMSTMSFGALSPNAQHAYMNLPWLGGRGLDDYWSGWLACEVATHLDREYRDSDAWPWDPTRPVAGQYEEWLAVGRAADAASASDEPAEPSTKFSGLVDQVTVYVSDGGDP